MMKHILINTILIMGLCYSQWTQLDGPWTGRIDDIVSRSFEQGESEVYVADINRGVYKSTNGVNWVNISWEGDDCHPKVMEVSSNNKIWAGFPDFYQSATYGLYLYDIIDQAWVHKNGIYSNVINNKEITAIAISPTNPDFIMVGCSLNSDYDEMVYKTIDSGNNWEVITIPDNQGSFHEISSIAFHPSNENFIIATCIGSAYLDMPDDDENQDEILDRNLAYAYRSSNGGTTWELVLEFDCTDGNVIFDPINPSNMYITADLGLYHSNNNGNVWQLINYPQNCQIRELAINPENSLIMYLTTDNGIYISLDAGETWEESNSGINDFNIISIEIDKTNHNIIYVGTLNSFFVSYNSGDNWIEHNTGLSLSNNFEMNLSFDNSLRTLTHNKLLKYNFDNNQWNTIYFVTNGIDSLLNMQVEYSNPDIMLISRKNVGTNLLHRSINGGIDWEPINTREGVSEECNYFTEIDPQDPSKIYFGGSHHNTDYDTYRFEISDDYGDTWNGLNITEENTVGCLEIDPNNSDNLYIGLSNLCNCDVFEEYCPEYGIYKSNDSGNSWTNFNDGLTNIDEVYSLTVDPFHSNRVFAGTRTGLKISEDYGETWENVNLNLDIIYSVGFSSLIPNVIFVSGRHSWNTNMVMKSTDNGNTWTEIPFGNETKFHNIEFAKELPIKFYASSNNGAWQYEESNEEYIISENVNWNGEIHLNTNVRLTNNSTLTVKSTSSLLLANSVQLIIEEGAEIIIEEDVELIFEEDSKLKCFGSFTAQGTASNPITITGDYWDGIYVSDSQVSLNYVNISGSESASMNITNSTGHISYCNIYDNNNGLSIKDSNFLLRIMDNNIYNNSVSGINLTNSSVRITDNHIESNGRFGILMLSGSNAKLNNNTITNNGSIGESLSSGIYIQNSNPELVDRIYTDSLPEFPINNEIFNNINTQVRVSFMTAPNLGVYELIENPHGSYVLGGFNHIYGGDYSLLRYNYERIPDGFPTPQPLLFAEVNYWNEDTVIETIPQGVVSGDRISTSPTAPTVINDVGGVETMVLQEGLIKEQEEEYIEARVLFDEYLNDEPVYDGIMTALGGVHRTYEKEDNLQELVSTLESYSESTNEAFSTTARTHLISVYQKLGLTEEAITMAESLIEDYVDTELEPYYILELALLLEETDGSILGRTENQQNIESRIQRVYTNYADSEPAELLRLLFGSDNAIQHQEVIPETFALHHAYPNPFNPKTNIVYDIP
jgi:parallel beta-helix repeat protein